MMHVPLLQVEDCAPFSGHRQLEAASSGGGNGGTCHVPPPSASPPPPVHSTSGCHLWNRVYFKLEFKSLPFPPCRSTTPPYFFSFWNPPAYRIVSKRAPARVRIHGFAVCRVSPPPPPPAAAALKIELYDVFAAFSNGGIVVPTLTPSVAAYPARPLYGSRSCLI